MIHPDVYLVYLEWPERCFRVSPDDIRFLKTMLPKGVRVTVAHDEAAFRKALPSATHVLTWHFHRDWYARAPRLKVVATPGAGRELVSAEAPAGVTVHFGGFHGALISETVVGFMLAWARGFFAVRQAPTGWPRTWLSDKCYTLAGTRAVIVGYGRIGRAIGAKLAAFGVEVTGLTRHGVFRAASSQKPSAPTARAVRSVLKTADWLILSLPATPETDDLLDAKLVAQLPRRCVVVNVGRGNAVDEAALVRALRSGRLAGAYLDVCKGEPTAVRRQTRGLSIDPENPQVPNLVLMPHACAFAPQYLRMFLEELKDEGLV